MSQFYLSNLGIEPIIEVIMQYSQQAEYYDKIYSFKKYDDEVTILLDLIKPYLKHDIINLLDVACGTGKHLNYLKEHFHCEGLDNNKNMLEIARKTLPDIVFLQADMTSFNLGKKYDIITCFFGSIGHVKTLEYLSITIRNFKMHLNDGGLIAIEPWHTPEQFRIGRTHMVTYEEPDLKIARVSTSQVRDGLSVLDLHHLVGTPDGTEYFVDKLELGLFEDIEYKSVLSEGGFQVVHEKIRTNGNGIYLVFKP
jgi:SAM-dependent methyltransferase